MSSKLTVAAAQLAPVFLDRDATVEKACRTMREAGAAGARLVAFPETYIPGYPYWSLVLDRMSTGRTFDRKLFAEAVEIPSPATKALCAAAQAAHLYAVVGLNERDGGTLYNTQLLLGPEGDIIGRRRKLVPTSHERMVWGRGDGRDLQVWPTSLGRLGALICYEHSNALYRYALQSQGEQIHVANWPGGVPGINSIIDAAIRHYAFEAQAFVVNATAVLTDEIIAALGSGGSVDKLAPGGGYSAIVGPLGQFLAGPELSKETLLLAELDFERIVDAKLIVDSAGHYARPDVVRLVLNRHPHGVLEFEGEAT